MQWCSGKIFCVGTLNTDLSMGGSGLRGTPSPSSTQSGFGSLHPMEGIKLSEEKRKNKRCNMFLCIRLLTNSIRPGSPTTRRQGCYNELPNLNLSKQLEY
ncbi:hypothetical protein WA026_016013 [Henosepilachna vigintioctopunctata]|uniref:Uncharacterized protein n=1 Tax=Henosepilachna vigintioctopunctata TaxID=420089 RepID=A0AAW1U357_9CUCU